MGSIIKQCIKSLDDFEFTPPNIPQKERSIAALLFDSAEISTIKRFEEVMCNTDPANTTEPDPPNTKLVPNAGLELFGRAPESTNEYSVSTFIKPAGNYEFPDESIEFPSIDVSNIQQLSFVPSRPSTDDERLRLQIIMNRNYIKFLQAQLSLYHIEADAVNKCCSESEHLSSQYLNYKPMTASKRLMHVAYIQGFINGLPTEDQNYKFSSDMLELNGRRITDR
jgi:hypothetical protein